MLVFLRKDTKAFTDTAVSLRAGGTIFAALLLCVRLGHAHREQDRRVKEIIVIMNGALAVNAAVITAAVINDNNSY